MPIDSAKFLKISDTLRQYRRAELKDFEDDLGVDPLKKLYCDPLPGDGILNTVMSSNTTFVLGRKGTGKSTVFARAQSIYREGKNVIPIYIDVKTLNDLASNREGFATIIEPGVDGSVLQAHLLRKKFLSSVVSEIIASISKICDEMSLWDRWSGKKRTLEELKNSFEGFRRELSKQQFEQTEIPVLRTITHYSKSRRSAEEASEVSANANAKVNLIKPSADAGLSTRDFDKTLEDTELYKEYSDIVFCNFPFSKLLDDIKDLLSEAGLKKLVIFFDDFSELNYIDQKLFVDVILSPLNNSSQEMVKLKVAGYPGRVYYGKIDSTKVDTIHLDFSELYEASEVQIMEASAQAYTRRLLEARFTAFKCNVEDYFDTSSAEMDDYYRTLFQATFNVPRLMGAVLHICYLDVVSKGRPVTLSSIRLASRKHYENTISQYFDRMNRFALEPYENKVDRQNQRRLLDSIVEKARDVRNGIVRGQIGGSYFADLSSPPVSHFSVSASLADVFSSLEANFFLSRYKDTRDKNGKTATVYALTMGLTELERLNWGYPDGRQYRNYFVQRCFDYNILIHNFLTQNKTIRCDSCGASFSMEQKEHFEFFRWTCPECKEGRCAVTNLAGDLEDLADIATEEVQLEPVELEILETLQSEGRELAAGEISAAIDTTYQLVGRRTSKLRDKGLVVKEMDKRDDRMKSAISQRAKDTYFAS
tara:strand:- start:9958 stop:12075 length:2118 start_codon:yes stop_codon:yes gene_type:complete